MKKYLFIGVFIVVSIIIAVVLLIVNKPEKDLKLIVVKEKHSVLYLENEKLTFLVFYNDDISYVFNDKTNAYLHDSKLEYKFMVDYFYVSNAHSESINDQSFNGYNISFDLPKLTGPYYLDAALLTIYNEDYKLTINLGTINVVYQEDPDHFPITSIEGIKHDDSIHLKQILIGIREDYLIDQVLVNNQSVEFFIVDNLLIINIENDRDYYFRKTYVEIVVGSKSYFIDNFEYFKNYELLSIGKFLIYDL